MPWARRAALEEGTTQTQLRLLCLGARGTILVCHTCILLLRFIGPHLTLVRWLLMWMCLCFGNGSLSSRVEVVFIFCFLGLDCVFPCLLNECIMFAISSSAFPATT